MFRIFVVLILAIYGTALFLRWDQVLKDTRNQLTYIVSMLSQSIRMTATTHEALLRGLGGELVAQGALTEPEKGRALIERYKLIDPGMAGFGLARADGQLLLVSTVAPGVPLPNLLASAESRVSFEQALAQDRLVWGRPYLMRQLNKWVVPLRVPVKDERGRVQAVMTAGYGILGGTAAWANITLPEGVHINILRDDGYFSYASPLHQDSTIDHIEKIFGAVVDAATMRSYADLQGRTGFITVDHLSVGGGQHRYMAVQRLDNEKLWASAHVDRNKLLRDWMLAAVVPTIWLVILLVIGYLVYRRTARQQAQSDATLRYQASHDALTRLPNRGLLHAEFQRRTAMPEPRPMALMLLDLNGFKEINDALGHHAGDELLRQIGPRLLSATEGHPAMVARLGGDEFAVLLMAPGEPSAVLALARRVIADLTRPYAVEGMQLEIGASMGLAFYPRDGRDSHELLRAADVAMYRAKRRTSTIEIYDRQLDEHTPERLALMAELGEAIGRGELVLHYQPKLELASGEIRGFEALVRWNHPEKGLLYPDKFMPFAELSEVIHRLTEAVLDQALAQQKKWKSQFGKPMSVAVNLSARNLIGMDIVSALQLLMSFHGTGPDELELEITESSLLVDPVHATQTLKNIAALGVRTSIDDFGTGYSSLSYLQQLPLSALKIDRSFVSDMVRNEQGAAIVGSTITMAHNLKLAVVAEGVEDQETLALLRAMGCDEVQGYFVSRPKPWPEIEAWLRQRAD